MSREDYKHCRLFNFQYSTSYYCFGHAICQPMKKKKIMFRKEYTHRLFYFLRLSDCTLLYSIVFQMHAFSFLQVTYVILTNNSALVYCKHTHRT